ncbi:beta strand repeat-containing protein [Persicitalea jodogahamensis]|uniref:DUF11 domain-containing protein n=1 Tax=Persicitalea jodogahamensis TaxID=402147 RepID=A0A8J3G9J2_9BACT|nr:CARDB domain-containing protein [Persicitalea jodogahamensis]GHB67270.1 hypothetical protein GCM10007390_20720 [Persicitalea jodogahamensis]
MRKSHYLKNLLSALVLILLATSVHAQLSTNTIKYQLTYEASSGRYTVWVVPDYSTPNAFNPDTDETGGTAQVTLKAPQAFDIVPGSVINIKGFWSEQPIKLNGGDFGLDPGFSYLVFGKDPSRTNYGPFAPNTPVALFSFLGNSCFGQIGILAKADPFVAAAAADPFSLNVEGSFYSRSGQPGNDTGTPTGGNQEPLEQFIDKLGPDTECRSDLMLTKMVDNATPNVGSNVVFTITVTNSGPGIATGVEVTDQLPSGYTFVSDDGATASTYNEITGLWTIGTILAGNSATLAITAQVNPTGVYLNYAQVSASNDLDIDSSPGNGPQTPDEDDDDQVTTVPVPVADLAITKTDGSATYTPGLPVTYTIVVSNAGPSDVTGATVADAIPASLTGVAWTSATAGTASVVSGGSGTGNNLSASVSIPAGAANTVTFTVTGTVSAATTGNLVNTATVAVPNGVIDPTPANNSATDTDTQNSVADLAITKTDGSATYTPGLPLTYTIVVSNAGPSNVIGATVADAIPASLTGVTWTSATAGTASVVSGGSGTGNALSAAVSIPAGAANTVTFTVTGTVSAATTGNLVNTATVTAPAGVTDNNQANNSATDTDTQNSVADLAITKTDGSATYTPGLPLTYTIVVSNAGPSNVTGATVADIIPASLTGVTWTSATAGTASVVTGATGNGNALSAAVSIPAGAANTVTFTVTGTVSPATTGDLVNTATVTAPAGVTDPTPANNSATDTDAQNSVADLAITKTDGSATYTPGTTTTYTIVVSNAGPSNVTGATVADNAPTGTTISSWTAAFAGGATGTASGSGNISQTVSLPSGGSITYTVAVAVPSGFTGNLVNTTTVTAPTGVTDNNQANNSATDTDTQNSVADLAITKTDGSATYTPGLPVTYTIVVSNAGPSNVTGATVADIIPASLTGVTWSSATAGTASMVSGGSGSGNALSAAVSIPAGAANTVTFTVTGTVSAATTGDLVNTATVTAPAGVTDNNQANNSATDTDAQNSVADLAITKTDGSATYTPGLPLTYTIVVSNAGPSNVIGATVADIIPVSLTGVTWSSATAGAASVVSGATGSGNALSAAVSIPAGAANTVTFTVTGTVSAATTGNLVNTATVTAPAGVTDNNQANNSATDTDAQNSIADLAIVKTLSIQRPEPGANVTFTLVVTNDGPSAETGVVVTDVLPAGFTYVSDNGAGAYTGGTWNIGAMTVGSTASLQIVATINATGSYVNTAVVSGDNTANDPNMANNTSTASLDAQILLPKVYLQGSLFGVTYSGGSTIDSLMRDDLRVKGLIPLISPYGFWNPTIPANTITADVLSTTGRNAIVDWVFVELRDATDPTVIVSSRSALLQRDGDIVDLDGVTPVPVRSPAGTTYYVAVRHRNHLAVMTEGAVTMTVAGTTVDFRKPSTPTFRKADQPIHQPQVDVLQGKAMWAGNSLRDNAVIYQGTSNDVNVLAQQVVGAPGNTNQLPFYILKGYQSGDINMNGEVVFQGTGNDVEFIYQNVIKNHPGNGLKDSFFVIQQQLPE